MRQSSSRPSAEAGLRYNITPTPAAEATAIAGSIHRRGLLIFPHPAAATKHPATAAIHPVRPINTGIIATAVMKYASATQWIRR
ncbi:MAG: hypothetical protein HDR92_03000 [Bacteroides sp.]|nr:hypothetical protein [Bacteroides sp.]